MQIKLIAFVRMSLNSILIETFQVKFYFFSNNRILQWHSFSKWISKSQSSVLFKPKQLVPILELFAEWLRPVDPSQKLRQASSNSYVFFRLDENGWCWNVSNAYQWISQPGRLQCATARLERLLCRNLLPRADKYFENSETCGPESEETFR